MVSGADIKPGEARAVEQVPIIETVDHVDHGYSVGASLLAKGMGGGSSCRVCCVPPAWQGTLSVSLLKNVYLKLIFALIRRTQFTQRGKDPYGNYSRSMM